MTISLDTLGIPASSYTDSNATVDGVEFSWKQLGNHGNGLQWRATTHANGAGTLWNTSAFGKAISSIEFNYMSGKVTKDADAFSIEFGVDNTYASQNTSLKVVTGTTSYTVYPNAETYTFVRITNTMGAQYLESIVFHFVA